MSFSHRRNPGRCAKCGGECEYDEEGNSKFKDDNACPICGEDSYPEAYNTPDENENSRICNGCGYSWEIMTDEEFMAWETGRGGALQIARGEGEAVMKAISNQPQEQMEDLE